MFSVSSIKAKFKRSGINYSKTFLWESVSLSEKAIFTKLFQRDEIGIIYYNDCLNYSWCLTNQRIIILNEKTYNLSDLIKVDFTNVKKNPSQKLSNTELTLFTNYNQFEIFLEENSWHVFYNIFKFIIDKNN